MVIDAGGGSARRRHRFPSSHSVLLVSMYLVLLSVLIPVAPPPRISHSPSSTCLKSIVSSAIRSSSRHSSVLSSATTFQTSATSPMLPPDLAPQGSTAPLIIAVSPTSPSLSTVPPCTSGDTRSTHPEQRLARTDRFCISKAPPPLHTASDPFTDAVTPSCCSVSYLDYTVHQCRSDLVSFIIAANLRRSIRGGVSHSCSIASFSVRSPDPATASVFNLRISPTLVSFLAGFDNDVFPSVIEPTLRQRQVLYRDKLFRVDLLSSPPIARFCPLRFNLLPHLGRDIEKGQFAPPLPCALIPTKRRNTPKYCARRLDRSKTLCLLPDVTLNTLNQNECDVNMLRSVSVTNYWLRHGNVEVQGFDPSKLLSSSSNSIVLSVPKKAKLALEIHLVSLRSFVEFRTDPTNFSAKSSQIGLLLGVAQSLGASHQKLLSRNSPTASYWCINVDFDYQLFLRTIALGIKVKLLYGVFHLAELDSPLIGFILLCFIMLSTFVVPSSMSPESYASVVNVLAL
ncbi:unnamed protein product [Brassica oleracea]